jgi:hypothetical protein
MASAEEKYALKSSVHLDAFNMNVDGKVVGPGPAHYALIEIAFRAAGAWIWYFAEASLKAGGKGHDHEWDTFIFKDRGTAKFGFTTPEVQGKSHAGGLVVRSIAAMSHLQNEKVETVGYLHSHPGGPQVAGEYAAEIFSPVLFDDRGGVYGDLGVVYLYSGRNWWIGVLTPKGQIKRAQLTDQVLEEIKTRRAAIESTEYPSKEIRKILKRPEDRIFVIVEDQVRQSAEWDPDWKPGTSDWRKKCVETALEEMKRKDKKRRR